MSQHAARCFALLWIATSTGCFFIPMWRVEPHPVCQYAEDTWGDVVDHVGNQSPIDRPWHDPHYVKRGVYRVAPPGAFVPVGGYYEHPPAFEEPKLIPAPLPSDEGPPYLKPHGN